MNLKTHAISNLNHHHYHVHKYSKQEQEPEGDVDYRNYLLAIIDLLNVSTSQNEQVILFCDNRKGADHILFYLNFQNFLNNK